MAAVDETDGKFPMLGANEASGFGQEVRLENQIDVEEIQTVLSDVGEAFRLVPFNIRRRHGQSKNNACALLSPKLPRTPPVATVSSLVKPALAPCPPSPLPPPA